MRRLLSLLAFAALAGPPAASAKTIELNWREDDGAGVMRFTVSTLSLSDGRWSVRGSFTNLSRVPLGIEPRFRLAIFPSPSLESTSIRLRARTFKPALPGRLLPGRTWRGAFGGSGTPPGGSYLRMIFGRFHANPSPLPDFPNGFSWVTAHYHRLR